MRRGGQETSTTTRGGELSVVTLNGRWASRPITHVMIPSKSSAFVTSTAYVEQGGQTTKAPETQIDQGHIVDYEPYTSDDLGAFPLGPQGPFGLVRSGNPPTEGQGLNLTYRGILTEPMFQAILHALDISGKGKTLSVPRVTTVNNNPAKLRNGEDLRYFEEFKAGYL